MLLQDFDFELPEDRIALRPARPRDAARLLVSEPQGPLQDRFVSDLPSLLRPGDVLVFNDTKTIPAALKARRAPRGPIGGPVEADINLHQRLDGARWKAFARPAKRLAPGETLSFGHGLTAHIEDRGAEGELVLAFSCAGAALDAAIVQCGAMPLPPYIARKRAVDVLDDADYQTIYAKDAGSVATPTAGLHFTPAVLAGLAARDIACHWVTLHVGAGTFLPVKTERIADHVMHSETYDVPEATADAINQAKSEGRRVIAVGTTSLRTLESVITPDGAITPGRGDTQIFLTPDCTIRSVDGLMTNFHLPRSTLLMLVGALIGMARMQTVYRHAIAHNYRFYSYGDASLLWKEPGQ